MSLGIVVGHSHLLKQKRQGLRTFHTVFKRRSQKLLGHHKELPPSQKLRPTENKAEFLRYGFAFFVAFGWKKRLPLFVDKNYRRTTTGAAWGVQL